MAEDDAIKTTVKRLVHELEGIVRTVGDREQRIGELEARLHAVEVDSKDITERLVSSEHQTGRLMNLYVATYQLHATLDPAEVQATIADIATNLLGAEKFVLLLRREEDGRCEVALAQGLDAERDTRYARGTYTGGDVVVDATLHDGALRVGPTDASPVVAVVPLSVQASTVGALVILKLFDHKAVLAADDRDLLDLLAAHAASALFAARLYTTTDRKLRTLESLVKLVRGGDR